MKYCCATGCSNNILDHESGVSFFRLPKDAARLSQWMENIGNPEYSNYTPEECYSRLRLCSDHFEEHCFSSIQKNRLKRNAIPTLFNIGKPAKLEDIDHMDWAPSQHMGHMSSTTHKENGDIEIKVGVVERRKVSADAKESRDQINLELMELPQPIVQTLDEPPTHCDNELSLCQKSSHKVPANMSNCSVASCKNYRRLTGKGISYHRFPKDEEIREKWLKVVQPRHTITKNSYVCSVHFSDEDFESYLQAKLLNLPGKRRLIRTGKAS